MRKGFRSYTIAWGILLVLFNVIAFVSPGLTGPEKYTSSFWIGYAFIMICLIGNMLCANFAFQTDNAGKLFYNMPLVTISYTALIVSFLAGGLCMLFPKWSWRISVIICAVILALYIIAIVKASAAAGLVERVDEKVQTQTAFIRSMTAEVESLMSRAGGPEAKAACKKVHEALRYSDPMSVAELSGIESEISSKLDVFSLAIGENDKERLETITDELITLVHQRNNKSKAVK